MMTSRDVGTLDPFAKSCPISLAHAQQTEVEYRCSTANTSQMMMFIAVQVDGRALLSGGRLAAVTAVGSQAVL